MLFFSFFCCFFSYWKGFESFFCDTGNFEKNLKKSTLFKKSASIVENAESLFLFFWIFPNYISNSLLKRYVFFGGGLFEKSRKKPF